MLHKSDEILVTHMNPTHDYTTLRSVLDGFPRPTHVHVQAHKYTQAVLDPKTAPDSFSIPLQLCPHISTPIIFDISWPYATFFSQINIRQNEKWEYTLK